MILIKEQEQTEKIFDQGFYIENSNQLGQQTLIFGTHVAAGAQS